MKKILLLITCLTTVFSKAQYFEGFESGFPGTMTQTLIAGTTNWTSCGGDTGGAICPISGTASATFYLASTAAEITTLSTPVLDLSAGNYRLSFKHIQRSRAGKKNLLYAEISQNGGTSWATLGNFFTEVINVKKEIVNLPAVTTSNCKIRFRAVNKYGYAIILDDIAITPIQANDATMNSVQLNAFYLAGNVSISGFLKNSGLNPITNVDVNWQVDNGAIFSSTLSGLNLLSDQTMAFTHNDIWNATAGQHIVNIWVTNTNGADMDNSNDLITKNVSVASNSVPKFPLFEKFTSSTCPPCATFDVGFGPFYTANKSNLALINYQVNWPSTGDPYFTSEVNTRRQYYGVNFAPNMFIDSEDRTDSSAAGLNANLATAIAKPAYFGLAATYSIIGNNVEVNANITPYLDGVYKLYIAVVEKVTTGNATTNGETEFKNVMMKMIPNANGTVLTCTHDLPINTNFTANVANGTYINPALTGTALTAASNKIHTEDINDLEVIVFVQDADSKMIMQAAKASSLLAIDTFNTHSGVKLYPNPSTGIIKITTENPVSISIIDLLGKVVYSSDNLSNNSIIDLSSLQKGIYFAKIVDGNKAITQKLILK